MLGAASATFLLKYQVRDLERDLAELHDAIEEEQWRHQTLRADLAFLTRPGRIAMQAEQLGMVPARADRVATVASIARDDQLQLAGQTLPVTLPSGDKVELRFKPVLLIKAAAGALH
jgi:hypothetical protein